MPAATGAQVIVVLASRPAPIDETKARPAIEQFLWNENKRRMVQNDMKALRDASKIEYVGKYAEHRPCRRRCCVGAALNLKD